MAHDHLGLSGTPPERQEVRLSITVASLFVAVLIIVFPWRGAQLAEVHAFVPLVDCVMLFSELIIATLLYAQAAVFRSRALTLLASAYLFTGLLLVPHAMTFPGAFSPTGLLGAGASTTAWLAVFRRLTFPAAVICYALLKRREAGSWAIADRPKPPVYLWLAASIVLAGIGTCLTTVGHDRLPAMFANSRDTVQSSLILVNLATILLTCAAMLSLFRQQKSVLEIWLLVALTGWFLQSLLNITLQTRFTLGWYGLNAMTVAASLFVMVALIADTNRLYAKLALHLAARERERDDRLMSMGAVAAAMAHEIGQPLTASRLSTSAGLDWLKRDTPDREKAIESLQCAIDASDRTFAVIKSIRGTFTKESGSLVELNVNDLLRDTVALLTSDLTARKVSLQLELEPSVPIITANRVQLQRVLINLIVNAIESVSSVAKRPRRIDVRSAVHDCYIQIEIRDTGAGISADMIAQVFEPFITTKATGTGLGLSLSRSIVEEHGGRLWASSDQGDGATFYLQIPATFPAK